MFGPLITIAERTREREVLQIVGAAMLLCANVFDVKRECNGSLG
jgi:hypothetical protein